MVVVSVDGRAGARRLCNQRLSMFFLAQRLDYAQKLRECHV
jgi:hypothetical protein